MSTRVKNLDELIIKTATDQTCDLNQFLKSPITSSPKKVQNIKTVKQKLVESVVVLVDDQNSNSCPTCIKLKQKIEQLRFIGVEVGYLKQRNDQFLEQIQLLTSNFAYILQLATENITKGLRSRVQNIVRQKQKIIEKQVKIIQRLQKQSQMLINKIDHGLNTKEKFEQLEQKVRKLQIQNKTLRETNERTSKSRQDSQSIQMHSTIGEEGEYSPKQLLSKDFNFSSVRMGTVDTSNPQFGVKKRKTLQMLITKQKDHVQSQQIKSLDNLRLKINEIKSKIINQKF